MHPWWDSAWLWSGVGIVAAAFVAAVVLILLIVSITRAAGRPKT